MKPLDVYLHDSANDFRVILRGELAGERVIDVEHAWTTAKSILTGRKLVVDVSGVRSTDESGRSLLWRMREAGAVVIATKPKPARRRLWLFGIR